MINLRDKRIFRRYQITYFLKILLLYVCCFACTKSNHDEWITLFDGTNLSQWETYLGPRFGEGVSWDNINEQKPIGFNNDTIGVFQIVELEGEKLLKISGEVWGGIFTKKEFTNYHLQFQFKWGNKRWHPKEKDKRDSGLLYHGIGEYGENDLFWIKSQEFQLQEGDCGDYWGVGGTIIDVRAELMEDGKTYQYDSKSSLLTFSKTGEYGRNCKKNPDTEKPTGSWNTIDLYCFGGKSIHLINGEVTMVLENSRHIVEGKELPLTKGKIGLQSEAAEVFYKNIRIKSINRIPDNVINSQYSSRIE